MNRLPVSVALAILLSSLIFILLFSSMSLNIVADAAYPTITVGTNPQGVAYAPSNGDMYVANYGSGTVSVISTSSNTVVTTITVGSSPYGVAYASSNSYIYVTNYGSGTVSVISTSSNTVVATIKVGSSPYGITYDSSNGNIYVANVLSSSVSVISTSSNTVVATITVSNAPYGVAYASSNGYIYVTNFVAGTVSVISTSSNTVVATITVGTHPFGVAYAPSNGDMYVANNGAGTVSVISTSSNTVVATITVGPGPFGVAYASSNGDIFVPNFSANTVSVISTSSNTVVATITVGSGPYGVAYAPSNGDIYVTNFAAGTVSIISTLDSVTISPISATLDVGQSKTFTATPSGGSGSYTGYKWYVGGSVQSGQTASTFSYTPASAGSYLITATVTDSWGATSAQSTAASVKVNSALVAPTISPSPGAVNQGQTCSLTSTTVSTGTSPYSYQWLQKAPGASSYSLISSASLSSYSFVTSGSTVAGVWSFMLQVTDGASTRVAVNSTAVPVIVNGPPSVSISPESATLDVGQSKTFTATPSGGSGSYTGYKWYVGGSVQSGQTASTFSYTPASAGSYLITATVTDTSGVTSAQSTAASVKVNSALVAPTISPSPGTVNQGQTCSLTSSDVSTGTSPYSYQWLQKAPGAISYSLISDATLSSYSFATSGSTTIGTWSFVLQVNDSASTPVAVNSTAASVTVNLAPPILDHFVFDNISTQTAGTAFSITITAEDSNDNTVTSYVGTNSLAVSSGTVNPSNVTFTAGIWTGQITLSQAGSGISISTNGADKSGTSNAFTVIDLTPPQGSIIINNGAASTTSTSVTLSLTYSDVGSGVSQVRYSNDGVWGTVPWESPAASKPWSLSSGDGTKTVYYQVQDNSGLTSTTSATITLSTSGNGGNGGNGGNPPDTVKPIANAGQDQTIKQGTPVTFDGSSSSDNVGVVSYTWTFKDVTDQNLNGKTISYTFNFSGIYAITLSVKDAAGNVATDSMIVTVSDGVNPIAEAGPNQEAHVGATVSFDAGNSNDNVGITSYEWNFGDGSNGTGKTTTHTYARSGNYDVKLTVKDQAGNTATDDLTVAVSAVEFPLFYVTVVVAIIVVATIVVLFLLRFFRKRPKLRLKAKAEPVTLVANGSAKSIITLQLVDQKGKPIAALADTPIRVSATKGKLESPVVTIPKGRDSEKTILVSSTETGPAPVSVNAEGLKSITITLNFTEKSRYCMHCGTQLAANAKVCQNCGLSPPAGEDTKACQNCEAVIPVVAKFCSECGAGQTV